MYFTYIIRCKDDSLYTGYTSNIERRMNEHKSGINSKYTRARGFKKLEVYFVTNTKSNAMKLEYYIKKLTRDKKLSIIKNPNILIDSIDNKENYIIGEEIKELK
ncbi:MULTISPECIES: GIY-YIG nuclease family protein [unclassified Clostridioides]|uniref:GIY-YIG nuclease family protein n=1 Tax=unclassified Clostridioides TaxID=2635829 RepID=UPI001D0CAFEC|nr:GIY-YIG nuclease family protein [Clostridioides sp. ES-S-0001-02]MCC0640108.1 GIY-YIG nuclease family protein [Clostridioides sp. ES-S-0049-03]MCC0652117.1 GIY-YIG nuclease family protein [Clostridioides sp. ES-S-0001-03]MCC0655546.1 GIY-YIG nuclease family protein [Clostridioides sp. ES-S-0123-01]MCC0673230.1 GIY-YIG nuclease family protein [Clostridioides sp. ES-S-0145-01]MCC0674670.1 GIY-YIG nuclease family protein [Clostridioides sp. ES-W-0018-02]MCC0679199.1 GIY-YIG nuclease family pr